MQPPAHAAGAGPRKRLGLLAVAVVAGLLVAAATVAVTIIAATSDSRPTQFKVPLRVYPVSAQIPGACPAGTQGISGQGTTGAVCYQLTDGMTIRKVTGLRVQRGKSGYEISMSLMPAQRRALARVTRASVGKEMALVVRNQVVTAPRVDSPITEGQLLISGVPTKVEAERLIDQLTGTAAPPQPVLPTPTPTFTPPTSSLLPADPNRSRSPSPPVVAPSPTPSPTT